jgi:hypothetical protein
MAAVVIRLVSQRPRSMEVAAALRVPPDELTRKAELCMSVLTEARRQIAARRFGPLLSQLLARVCDLLDEMDEALIRLDPIREHEQFVRSAALHRELEAIQSLVPSKYRSLARGGWLG